MATKHAWNTINKGSGGGSGGGGGSDKFFKPAPGGKNKFRPLGDPVVFYRYYQVLPDGKFASAITDDPENCPVAQKHNIEPKKRAAINVIDRHDGKLKIYEGPYANFVDMKTMWEGEGSSPGGADGADFGIMVDIPNGNKKLTRYKVTCYGATTITPEEKQMIIETGPDGKIYQLEKEFQPTPVNEIEAKLGLVQSKSSANKGSSGFDDVDDAPKKAVAKKPVAADDEDMTF
jgi:hypothetical protein